MEFSELLPGPTDRAALVGQTGSGKTTLARVILERRGWVVCYDPKGLLDWDGWEIVTSLRRACASESSRLIYKPSYDELSDPKQVDEFFKWVYQRENTTVYVDEIYAIARGDIYPYYYGACLTRGREKGISVISATQRPAYVPGVMFSESEYVYSFKLKLERDRKKVADMTGVDPDAIRKLRKHFFYFAPQDADISGPYTLKLASQ